MHIVEPFRNPTMGVLNSAPPGRYVIENAPWVFTRISRAGLASALEGDGVQLTSKESWGRFVSEHAQDLKELDLACVNLGRHARWYLRPRGRGSECWGGGFPLCAQFKVSHGSYLGRF